MIKQVYSSTSGYMTPVCKVIVIKSQDVLCQSPISQTATINGVTEDDLGEF